MNFFVKEQEKTRRKSSIGRPQAEKIVGNLLKCPSCHQLPLYEVYQCRNGHAICKKCISERTSCSTCRVPFEEEKIRNRLIESLLENVEGNCPNWESGCRTVALRKNLGEHLLTCKYGPIQLCKILWNNDCTFSSDNLFKITEHMKSCHGAHTLESKPLVEICLKNFGLYVGDGRGGTFTYPTTWVAQVSNAVFLIFLVISGQHDCHFHCLYDGLEEEIAEQCNLAFKISADKTATNIMSWTVKPTYFKSVRSVLLRPTIRMNSKHILEELAGRPMKLSVSIPFPVEDYFVQENEMEMVINEWLKQKHNLWMRLAEKEERENGEDHHHNERGQRKKSIIRIIKEFVE